MEQEATAILPYIVGVVAGTLAGTAISVTIFGRQVLGPGIIGGLISGTAAVILFNL